MAGTLIGKLAPHMIVGLEGPRLAAEERSLLSRYPFAGVILFERNVQDARTLMELTREIRGVFRDTKGAVPLVAADHEGGIISVLARAIGVPPTQMAAARTGDPRLCERLFSENARRMRACGVNMLLGPVADVNAEERNPVIGTRSFGGDAGLVASLVSIAVSSARREGVLTCIKHFPGHGPSSVDSHLALPVLDSTLDELRRKDVPPFGAGFAAGAESVMMGHIAPRGRTLPASLDPDIVGGLLRGELGFAGAVVTDALEMEGVRGGRSLFEICSSALAAGNDILLFSKPAQEVLDLLRAGEDAAAGNSFWGERFDEISKGSVPRLERLAGIAGEREKEFELPVDAAVYREIADRSIEARGDAGSRPLLRRDGGLSAIFHCDRGAFERFPARSFVERVLKGLRIEDQPGPCEGARGPGSAADWLARNGLAPHEDGPGDSSGLDVFVREAGGKFDARQNVVFLANRGPIEEAAVRKACATASVVIVAGWPYAARFVPSGTAVLVTCGIYDAAADALCRLLLGLSEEGR